MVEAKHIIQLLDSFQNADEGSVAFSLYNGERVSSVTYKQLYTDILKAAGYFKSQGIYNQHIALLSPNSYEWIVTFFGIIVSGNVVVPMNQALPLELLKKQMEQADISVVCGEEHTLSALDKEILDVRFCLFDEVRTGSFDTLDSVCRCRNDNEVVLMLFTSGTTGMSKVVMLDPDRMFFSINNWFSTRKGNRISRERELLVLPLYHVGSLRAVLYRLKRKETICIGRGPQCLFIDMPELNPTVVAMVPAIAESLIKIIRRVPLERRREYVGENLYAILSCGASLKPSAAEYLMDQGIQVEIVYGMTESDGHGTWSILEKGKLNTIGKPDGDISIRIRDGEILLKSKAVMLGYYQDPEETKKVIEDGWLHTGDMGYCDEDGYYYITGRKKNVIILANGENVNPEEIEAVFGECDAVEEVLVYSDGKGICADVFTKEADIAAAFIKIYNENMPMYRQVYKVNYTSEPLIKTGSGKIKRKGNM